jgi:hypothetical protein
MIRIWIFAVSLGLFLFNQSRANAWSLKDGVLTEDFTEVGHWDISNSSGLWNMVTHSIQAGRVMGGQFNQPLFFGDGSDGVLQSSLGYVFDTDTHPSGFNFISVQITGGTIVVQGKNPLLIRSLSTIEITPPISVRGGNGATGSANTSLIGPTGGIPVASQCAGGQGGNAESTSPQGDGASGLTFDRSNDLAGGGIGGDPPATISPGGPFDSADSATLWGTGNAFRCGAGGGGGGGYNDGAGHYATGGAGGAGGGTVQMIAVGPVLLNTIDASGGDGAMGADANSGNCSGSGAGGNAGAIWLQSLESISASTLVLAPGASATTCLSSAGSGYPVGFSRIDDRTSSTAGAFTTEAVASNQIYQIQSLAYDLGTRNANFPAEPILSEVLNGGTLSITYSGSSDGIHFSNDTADLRQLSQQNIRYLKFKVTITTPTSAGLTPELKSISIPFEELDIQLKGGCGSTRSSTPTSNTGLFSFLFLFIFSYLLTHSRIRSNSIGG